MTTKLNILLIGSGGREHAFVRALKKSPSLGMLVCAPGSDAIARDAACLNFASAKEAVGFAKNEGIDLVIIGPEQPLVDGWADSFRAAGIAVFGPSAKAARIEASKDFTKRLCDRYRIPTARYATFHDAVSAKAYVNTVGAPVVIKADGLAAGKGVSIAMSVADAEDAIEACFDGAFGEAGSTVVIEEFLEGEEVSFFALCDGVHVRAFGSAQDHKRAFDGDMGPNTGGMGTYSPAPVFASELEAQVMREIILPAVDGLSRDGAPYVGVLFAGLMLTRDGPKLIEFNCRFGDPETQVVLPRFEGDFAALCYACATGNLASYPQVTLANHAFMCVVMATKGYPLEYQNGSVIGGIENADAHDGVHVLHAGTKYANGNWQAHGGRVLNVIAEGADLKEAHARAYKAANCIDWPEGFYRRDIGWRALK